LQFPDEIAHIDTERGGNLKNLDEVEPAFAAFVLGHKGLGPPEEFGELCLGDAPCPARFD